MTVVALVPDLLDRARIAAVVPDVVFARKPARAAGAEVVVIDLARYADRVAEVRAATTGRIVAFGAHVDLATLAAARAAGADAVMARSRFFADPAAAVAGEADETVTGG